MLPLELWKEHITDTCFHTSNYITITLQGSEEYWAELGFWGHLDRLKLTSWQSAPSLRTWTTQSLPAVPYLPTGMTLSYLIWILRRQCQRVSLNCQIVKSTWKVCPDSGDLEYSPENSICKKYIRGNMKIT